MFGKKQTPAQREALKDQIVRQQAQGIPLSGYQYDQMMDPEMKAAREAQASGNETARRVAKLTLEQPPDWLKQGKSLQRLPSPFTGQETINHYDRRQLVVKALQQAEFEYRRAAARQAQTLADEWLLKIAGYHAQLRKAMEPEALYNVQGKRPGDV